MQLAITECISMLIFNDSICKALNLKKKIAKKENSFWEI